MIGSPWPSNLSDINSDRGNDARNVTSEAYTELWWLARRRNENLSIQKDNTQLHPRVWSFDMAIASVEIA